MLHLFHPALVHFSVAFLIFGALCEAWGLLALRPAAASFGGKLVVVGVLSLTLTVLSGYVAANSVSLTPEAQRLLDAHELNAWLVAGVYMAALFWKGWVRGELPREQRVLYALLLIAAAGLTAYSALLGGEMVYLHGAGVR